MPEQLNCNNEANKTKEIPKFYAADFDPFQDELLLVTADRLASASSSIKPCRSTLPATQGFQTCKSFLDNSINDDNQNYLSEKLANIEEARIEVSPAAIPIHMSNKLEDFHIEITDSELINFCHAAEQRLTEPSTPPQTPTNNNLQTKSIVEQILDDFYCSPEQYNIDISTPTYYFKHKSKSLRTYVRRKSNKILEYQDDKAGELISNSIPTIENLNNADAMSTCSSDLSVQEDTTVALNNISTVVLNNSEKICEQLLNLSAYFSQLDAENSPNDDFNASLMESNEIVDKTQTFWISSKYLKAFNELLALRQKYPMVIQTNDGFDSDDDFCGFSSQNNNKNSEQQSTKENEINLSTSQRISQELLLNNNMPKENSKLLNLKNNILIFY